MNIPDTDSANKQMQELYKLSVQRIARAHATVLIQGESGTGKERMANLLHYHSPRQKQSLVKVNCAALPEGVLESELFGHEKGAFTGAIAARRGRFEISQNGTIFLDEIADLTPLVQAKLLRVLQEREFERVGGIRCINIDVRVIAATNRQLKDEVEKGNFREDLFYRLNVVTIDIPPLRERSEDILPLTEKFINRFCEQNQRKDMQLDEEVADRFLRYHWPGNVRELENLIERFTVIVPEDIVCLKDLPPEILNINTPPENDSINVGAQTLGEARADFERRLIERTLAHCKGNVSASSGLLGIARKNLQHKINNYDIEIEKFRGLRTDTEA